MTNLGNGHRNRQLKREHRARCQAANLPCVHCQRPINYGAPANHPDSFESDHIISVKARPDLAYVATNLQPSCCRCNRSRKDSPMPTGRWVQATW